MAGYQPTGSSCLASLSFIGQAAMRPMASSSRPTRVEHPFFLKSYAYQLLCVLQLLCSLLLWHSHDWTHLPRPTYSPKCGSKWASTWPPQPEYSRKLRRCRHDKSYALDDCNINTILAMLRSQLQSPISPGQPTAELTDSQRDIDASMPYVSIGAVR